MHSKPTSSLFYARALKPLMTQTFEAPRGVPETMRALLAQIDQAQPADPVELLMAEQARDAQAASRTKN